MDKYISTCTTYDYKMLNGCCWYMKLILSHLLHFHRSPAFEAFQVQLAPVANFRWHIHLRCSPFRMSLYKPPKTRWPFSYFSPNVGQCWMKSLNEIKFDPISCNMVFKRTQWPTCCAQQCWIMLTQQVKWIKKIRSTRGSDYIEIPTRFHFQNILQRSLALDETNKRPNKKTD